MTNPQDNFTDLATLNSFIQDKGKGGILITYRNCEDYAGMTLSLMIVFDLRKPEYKLDLQWMALGLDLYGDTLQESYVYSFESLEKLLEYLEAKYAIQLTDIPVSYHFDQTQYPNPLTHADQKSLFEAAWEQFQLDFKSGAFLDTSLTLVYNSSDF